eukprot:scaffold586855_cov41-Prasinocladus_malaysianus.AAC.1
MIGLPDVRVYKYKVCDRIEGRSGVGGLQYTWAKYCAPGIVIIDTHYAHLTTQEMSCRRWKT